ncbi:hypothetical protein IscW_ISCW008389 [Ixodes scapularis]|uniref:Uncharacterized protein n=1 Tax=Ixodes scapularis TaxID=6945 RepID=B7PTP3_IXOSC|nr:hypothetical protein IscW_ISCW008389 [Ixodes scapularis]|eukprot:XP_002404751.1 hypothetical protein IscW_ISCW008389 [Ixodes scapularis]
MRLLERVLEDLGQFWHLFFSYLAIFGFLLGILAMLLADWNALLAEGFFQGYNSVTWTVIFLQSVYALVRRIGFDSIRTKCASVLKQAREPPNFI